MSATVVLALLPFLADLAVYVLAAIGAWYVGIGRALWERELDQAEKRLHRALFEEER